MTKAQLRTPSSEVRPAVLRAAIEILATGTLNDFGVRDISAKAKVAPMAIYNHFDGMGGLLGEIWDEGFTALRQALTTVPSDSESALEQGCLNYREFALAHRGHYRVMFLQHFESFEPSVRNIQAAGLAFQALVDLVTADQANGRVRIGAPQDIAQIVWSSCHGYVALEMQGQNFSQEAAENYRNLLVMITKGLDPRI